MPRSPIPLIYHSPLSLARRRSTWRQSPQLSVGLVRNHIQGAIRSLSHVSHALAAIRQQVLFARDSVVLDDKTDEAHLLERADEQVVAPRGKCVAGVELCAGGSDHGIPVVGRLVHSGPGSGCAGDGRSAVLLT